MNSGYKKFFLLWLSSLISATGAGMTSFGLGIYIFKQTGLSALTGLLLLLGFLPGLLLSPLAGVLADRYDRRYLMMLGDGLSIPALIGIMFSIFFLRGQALVFGIGVGVVISSSFSALVEPSFRATISELVEKENYSKASGMVMLVSSARYLLSPIFAGLILTYFNIVVILIIDILTIFLTLPVTFYVKKEMRKKLFDKKEKFTIKKDFKFGFELIYRCKGIWTLVIFGAVISFYLGTIQTLITPMILSFSDEGFLGFVLTFSSCGMVLGGAFLGLKKLKLSLVKILILSLTAMGFFMIGFSIKENKLSICIFGFCMFLALPFGNMAIDCLVRMNIPKQHQGKAWGFIGIISQLGYVFAYSSVGTIFDYISKPLLIKGGVLENNIGRLIGVGEGRGAALIIAVAGFLLILTSLSLTGNKELKILEDFNVQKLA